MQNIDLKQLHLKEKMLKSKKYVAQDLNKLKNKDLSLYENQIKKQKKVIYEFLDANKVNEDERFYTKTKKDLKDKSVLFQMTLTRKYVIVQMKLKRRKVKFEYNYATNRFILNNKIETNFLLMDIYFNYLTKAFDMIHRGLTSSIIKKN